MDDTLCPERCLPAIVKRSDVLDWGKSLKKTLQPWVEDGKSPFSTVRRELGSCLFEADAGRPLSMSARNKCDFEIPFSVRNGKKDLVTMALPLLTDLHACAGLPGILFNYDRDSCENTVVYVLAQLEKAEKAWKEDSTEWARTINEYGAWKKAKNQGQENKTERKKRPGETRGQGEENLSKTDMMRDASVETSKWDSFDPETPLERFSFADERQTSGSELQILVERLIQLKVQPEIVAALRRGIAVHHAGMNRDYRQM